MSFSTAQYEAARMMRDNASQDLWEVLPKLRPDAVKLTVSPDDLAVTASVQGNLEPYTHDDVVYCLGALNVTLVGVETVFAG